MSLFKKKSMKKEESESPKGKSLSLALNVQRKNMNQGGKASPTPFQENTKKFQKGFNSAGSQDPIVKGVKKLFGMDDKEENYAEGGEVESNDDMCPHCSGIGYLTQKNEFDRTESELPNPLESHQPLNSNEHGDILEDADEHNKDSISKIMRKMKNK